MAPFIRLPTNVRKTVDKYSHLDNKQANEVTVFRQLSRQVCGVVYRALLQVDKKTNSFDFKKCIDPGKCSSIVDVKK
jgi:hypothetical protein